jgi:hypothetical protein
MTITRRTAPLLMAALALACVPDVEVPPPAGQETPAADGEAHGGVTWQFPGLIQTPMGTVFPTYLAHLFGKRVVHPLTLETACVSVTNRRPTPLRARLRVDLAVYARPSTQDFTVPVGHTASVCLNPTFDLGQMYALRDSMPARIETVLTDLDSGAELGAAMRSLAISPANDISWSATGAGLGDMIDLVAVFATPRDPQVDQLQRLVLEQSAWKDMGGLDGYERPALVRTHMLAAGQRISLPLVLEDGERLSWRLASVTGGGHDAVDVELSSNGPLEAYQGRRGQLWPGQTSGMEVTVTPGAGTFFLALTNPATATSPLTVAYTRTSTRLEVAADALRAIYTALQKRDTKYSNVTNTFFDDWQYVRRPREALEALSANCLEGSLLFASVLELVGMEPVIVTRSAHAYVGVRSAPGSAAIWPVETTLLGSASFEQAFAAGVSELGVDARSDPRFRPIDIKAMRARGILPLPQ